MSRFPRVSRVVSGNAVRASLVILGLTSLIANCQDRQSMPRGYSSFPKYTGVRDHTSHCLSEPDSGAITGMWDARHAELWSSHRPSPEERSFIAISLGGRPLTWVTSESKEQCLLLFTSAVRANYYGAEILGRDKPLEVTLLSAQDVAKGIVDLGRVGISSITIDKCVHCDVQTVIPLTEIKNSDDVIRLWALYSTTRELMGDLLLKDADDLFSHGEYGSAKAICLDVIECVDVDRPDAHLLLGKCARRLGDSSCLSQVEEFLTVFDPHWGRDLQADESEARH